MHNVRSGSYSRSCPDPNPCLCPCLSPYPKPCLLLYRPYIPQLFQPRYWSSLMPGFPSLDLKWCLCLNSCLDQKPKLLPVWWLKPTGLGSPGMDVGKALQSSTFLLGGRGEWVMSVMWASFRSALMRVSGFTQLWTGFPNLWQCLVFVPLCFVYPCFVQWLCLSV